MFSDCRCTRKYEIQFLFSPQLAGGICGNQCAMFWALCEAFIILFKNPYPKFIPPQSVCKYDGKCVESGCLCSP